MRSNLAFGKTHVNSLRQIYNINVLLKNVGMDIDDIRRANICALEKEVDTPAAAADRVSMTYSQYVNLRDGARDPRSGKPRGMRKETAWRFEDAFGKPRGWLDQSHETPGLHTKQTVAHYHAKQHHTRPLVQQACDLAERIDDNGLRELIGFARCLTGTHPLIKVKSRSFA